MIIKATKLGIRFDQRWLFRGLDIELKQAEILAITGRNGIGKTSLVKALMSELDFTEGSLDAFPNRREVAFIPQFRFSTGLPAVDVKSFVALGYDRMGWPWLMKAERQRLADLLEVFDLTQLANKEIRFLSGGERQRVYLAQALLRQPKLLVLDETTANIDAHSKYEMMDLVATYRKQHQLSVLLISHDTAIVERYADRQINLEDYQVKVEHV